MASLYIHDSEWISLQINAYNVRFFAVKDKITRKKIMYVNEKALRFFYSCDLLPLHKVVKCIPGKNLKSYWKPGFFSFGHFQPWNRLFISFIFLFIHQMIVWFLVVFNINALQNNSVLDFFEFLSKNRFLKVRCVFLCF